MDLLAAGRLVRSVSFFAALCFGSMLSAQKTPVTVQIEVDGQRSDTSKHASSDSDTPVNIVVWLSPLDHRTGFNANQLPGRKPQLIQRNKSFEPHVLVVEVGTVVDFPNRDPFFHNVFSLFNGKRFDLGLYEAGATNSTRFDRAGVSFLFCNIHPEMSAVIVAVDTPYYGMSDRSGRITIPKVPDGRYEMHAWSERALPEDLQNLTRTVVISDSGRVLPRIHLAENPNFTSAHKNKYGQDYVPAPTNGYSHPEM